MEISASLVKELRERTGAPMMDCKKALAAVNGNMDAAVEYMRKAGQTKADKKAGRVAAEGIVLLERSASLKEALLLEVNCETDFVGRDDNFVGFAQQVAKLALQDKISDVDQLLQHKFPNRAETVDEVRKELIAKIGENITLRRLHYHVSKQGIVGGYVHGNRIGVLVDLVGTDEQLLKDIAMHIAANNPLVVQPEDFDPALLAKEQEIYQAQLQEMNKPPEILQKIIIGRMQKFKEENSLLGQPFLRDNEITVGQLLKKHSAKVAWFGRFVLGEGIEKKASSFVEEVMAQVKGG